MRVDFRYIVFGVVLLIVVIFPIFGSKNYKIMNYETENVIPTIIRKGKFYLYDKNLTNRGYFRGLEIFSENVVAKDFFLEDLIKKEKLFAKKVVYSNPYLEGFNVKFQTNDYNLTTNYAIYNKIKKDLRGEKFKLVGSNFRGYGDKFFIDSNKNIEAENVRYILKVN